MERMTLNNELQFPVPEGFHVMDEEEMSGMTMLAAGPGVCLKDPERHMVVSVGYKKAGLLTSKMLSQKDIAAFCDSICSWKRCREKRRNSRKVTSGNSVTYT